MLFKVCFFEVDIVDEGEWDVDGWDYCKYGVVIILIIILIYFMVKFNGERCWGF